MGTAGEMVPAGRLAAVRQRLAEVRAYENSSLRVTAEWVSRAAALLGERSVSYSEVRRYEGTEKGRENAGVPVGYVRSFARIFRDGDYARAHGMDERRMLEYLLAEDIPSWTFREASEQIRAHQESYSRQLRQTPRGQAEKARDQLRDNVAFVLMSASRFPIPPGTRDLPRDTLSWILDDLNRLFWEAFWGRGLTNQQLLERAWELGRLIPTPARLSRDGFLPYSKVDESSLRRWWLLQAEALRVLIRPTHFEPEDMNLGRYGQGGYPIPWSDWLSKWDEVVEMNRDEVLAHEQILAPEDTAATEPETP